MDCFICYSDGMNKINFIRNFREFELSKILNRRSGEASDKPSIVRKYIWPIQMTPPIPDKSQVYDICNDDCIDEDCSSSRNDTIDPTVSYDDFLVADIESNLPTFENPSHAGFLHNINDKLHHLRSIHSDTPIASPLETETHEYPHPPRYPLIHKTNSRLFSEPLPKDDGFPRIPESTRATLEQMFIQSNSPISSDHSDSDASDDMNGAPPAVPFHLIHEQVENVFTHTKMNYRKITYDEIEKSLSKYYDKNNKYSNEMDILITFMRGQKHIYKESANVAQRKQYAITFTSLTITALITVITPFIRVYAWSIILISGGNAIATVLMTALNYLRLDSGRNTFSLLSNHYEHFEHTLELTNNKLLFITNETEQSATVLEKIREIEFKMGETKELCPVIVPEEVKQTFPVICQTNIFSLIKKLEMYRKQLIIQFKDVKNEIRYILFKWNHHKTGEDTPQRQREKTRMLFLMDVKERIKKELIEYKNVYNQIDDLFAKEIKYAELNRDLKRTCGWSRKQLSYDMYVNPVIKEHLELIFTR